MVVTSKPRRSCLRTLALVANIRLVEGRAFRAVARGRYTQPSALLPQFLYLLDYVYQFLINDPKRYEKLISLFVISVMSVTRYVAFSTETFPFKVIFDYPVNCCLLYSIYGIYG